MRILTTLGQSLADVVREVNKSIGSVTIQTSLTMDELDKEKINIQIQRANGDNIEITNGNIPLKEYLLLGTMGDDAIGCNRKEKLAVKATVELVEHEMSAVHLFDKDLIRISLTGLNTKATYIIDGHEAPLTTTDVYTYERKSMNSEHENMDFDVAGFDSCVITDKETITEINLRFDNGNVVKTNTEELRQLGENFDPIAQVNLDGSVTPSFFDYLQLPLKGIVSVNIRKEQGDIVSLLLRHDQDLKV
ncbi:hypothetical protein ACSVH2_12605 [Flavobacterium sp. RSB2_4_14]|uniref:hypothetical protein n=1 Tax=Flavobacterium sp. RSB2_4_14 TaxID=3447665 RepID=UPI003F2E9A10